VCGAQTIAAYYAPFEMSCIEHLRENLPHLASELDAVLTRLVDLLPILREHVYHPRFGGCSSLERVLRARA
jgi:hypothetical protein